MREVINIIPTLQMVKVEAERLSNLPQFTQLVRGSLELELQMSGFRGQIPKCITAYFHFFIWFEASNKCQYSYYNF